MKKIALGTSILLALTTLTAFANTSLTYQQEIEQVVELKLVTEKSEIKANKCEVLEMMSRQFQWTTSEDYSHPFTDVPEWCDSASAYAYHAGIVNGRTETILGTEGDVSRSEVAVMLYRELKLQNFDFTKTAENTLNDWASTPDWAVNEAKALVEAEIIFGFEDNTFGGEKHIIKQDLGILLIRVDKMISSTTQELDNDLVGRWAWAETTKEDQPTMTPEQTTAPFFLTLGADRSLGISGDCNLMGGSVKSDMSDDQTTTTISFFDIFGTLMYCEDSYENTFRDALMASTSYTFENEEKTVLTLNITDEESTKIGTMKFIKTDPIENNDNQSS
ncbi:hypothetical protein CVV38_00560 [Candidatus Peregrinibacteria bacterium HGW-Peregrinibacteria-1]|jgi:heat shock protein HslJ|nr:MAG: hypothetical protein CVV38_00560 [Candidatus Peregrinibacteria bacterium HGW-Peregrinibacteria-1]